MHKRLLLLILTFVLMPATAWAQGAIQGTVTDDAGQPLPGASVAVLETMLGAATAADGTYRIDGVPAGTHQIAASFVGYTTDQRQVTVVSDQVVTVNFTLSVGIILEGITVDALGFAQDADRLGTSQTTVGGDALVRSGETSVLRALAAKSPGLNVTATGGDPGASTRIVIRGQSSIQGNNQPLIVIDGIPVSNATTGSGVDGVQQQSRLNDINPDDIEAVEVLRSAAAASVWGSRAQAGVIVITTKSGRGRVRPNVSVRSTLSFDEVNQVAELQSEFGQGYLGMYEFNPTAGLSWGDRVAGRSGGTDNFNTTGAVARGVQTGTLYYPIASGTPTNPHGGKNSQTRFNANDFMFGTGVYMDNTASVSGGDAQSRYYLSLGHLNQDGVIQGDSDYERTTVRLNADRSLSPVLGVSGSANFIRTASNRIQQGSNLAGLLLGGWRQPWDFDPTDYQVDYFPAGLTGVFEPARHRSYRNPLGAGTNPIYDNPLWTMHRHTNITMVNRIQGRVGANYDPMPWLNVTANLGTDHYTDRRETFLPQFTGGNITGTRAEQNISEFSLTGSLIGRATTDLTADIRTTALLGFNLAHRESDILQGSLVTLVNPLDFRSLANAQAANTATGTTQSVMRTLGAFAELDFDLYEQLFVKLTGRVDQASAFGPDASSTFFYPSVSLAWQFSELLAGFEPLSFGKLRATYGVVGREPNPYLAFTYINPQNVGDGWTAFNLLQGGSYGGAFARSRLQGNPFITPERKAEFEVGADLRFLDDRLTLGATYYDNRTSEAIFNVARPATTGFTVQTDNAAIIDNQGIELSSEFRWPQLGPVNWTTYASWWTNNNTVVDMAGVEEIGIAGFVGSTASLVEGHPFGVIFGTRWRRAPAGCTTPTVVEDCDPLTSGEQAQGWSVAPDGRVLNRFGFPVVAGTPGILGDPNPDWRAAFGNTFRVGPVSLNALFDFSIGGDVWNGTRGALDYFGMSGAQNWWTTISAAEAGTVGGTDGLLNFSGYNMATWATFTGVQPNADGSYSFRGFVQDFGAGPVIVDESAFWSGPFSGFTGPTEQYIEDGSFTRLRELTLGFNWADAIVRRTGLSSIDLSLTGRNLLTWTNYSGIDPETNLTGPSNGQGLDYFNNPFTRSYQFSVRFNY